MLCWRASPNRAAVGEKSIDVAKAVLLTVLASCGWTHVAQVVLETLRRQWYRCRRGVTTRSWPVQGDLVAWGLHRFASRFINPILTGRQTGQGQSENGSPIWWNDASAATTRGSRVPSRISAHESRPAQSAERDPALSQNPADNRIDLACPIQSETAPNNFRDHQSTHFLLTPSTPKCSAEGCRRHRRTSAI
jgi:hypothetical protein